MAKGRKEPKIILWDLEVLINADKLADEVFGCYEGVGLRADMSTICSFGYKEYGRGKAKCINAWDFPNRWEKNVNDDYMVCKRASKILNDADAIVTHFGTHFDMKFLNSRLSYHGLPTINTRILHIDTCMVARSNLKLRSNRLDNVAKFFGVGGKMSHAGKEMWNKVRRRVKKFCKMMSDYCAQDVQVLENIIPPMLPFIKNWPNTNLFGDNFGDVCNKCGSNNLAGNGHRYTPTSKIPQYRCRNCGSYPEGTPVRKLKGDRRLR